MIFSRSWRVLIRRQRLQPCSKTMLVLSGKSFLLVYISIHSWFIYLFPHLHFYEARSKSSILNEFWFAGALSCSFFKVFLWKSAAGMIYCHVTFVQLKNFLALFTRRLKTLCLFCSSKLLTQVVTEQGITGLWSYCFKIKDNFQLGVESNPKIALVLLHFAL